MPSVTIPLAGPLNTRGSSKSVTATIDQAFTNVRFEQANNTLTGSRALYATKFPTLSAGTVLSSGDFPRIMENALGAVFANVYQVTNGSITEIYAASVNCGSIGTSTDVTSPSTMNASGRVNDVPFIAFVDTAGFGWWLPKDAYTTALTFTGDTHTNTVIDNISSTTGLYVGQLITGAGIQANTRIATITSATAITTTIATTATATITVTRSAIAKVIDANWPIAQIPFSCVFMDGYVFWACKTGRIYQSGLNNPATIGASNYITANYEGDELCNIIKLRDVIVANGSGGSWEYFYNNGNPSGSVLSRQKGVINWSVSIFYKVTYFGDSVYFSGIDTYRGSPGFYKISGNAPQKISDDFIDGISGANVLSPVNYVYWGQKSYILLSTSLIYDIENNVFVRVSFGTLVSAFYRTFTKGGDDKVYTFGTNDSFASGATQLPLQIRTTKTDFGTEARKTHHKISLMGADIQADITPMVLDGAITSYASTPDSAAISIVGDIDIRINCAADDWTPSTQMLLISKYNTSANNRSWALYLSAAGNLLYIWSADGATTTIKTSSAVPSLTNGSQVWFRVVHDVDNGAAGNDVLFYTSLEGTTYTQLGATQTTAGVTSIFDSNADLMIGRTQQGAADLGGNIAFDGKVYYAEVRNGIAGTAVAKFDPATDSAPGATSFTASTGEVWTLSGAAYLTNEQVALLEFNDDDYATNSWVTAGEFDLTQANPFITRCGSHQAGRAWRLTHSALSQFRAQALKFDFDIGAH